jgi:hypothetical protein
MKNNESFQFIQVAFRRKEDFFVPEEKEYIR